MGHVGNSQANNMVVSSMIGEACRHIERLTVVVVVICDPRVISLIAIVCDSPHRCHRQCMHIQKEGN